MAHDAFDKDAVRKDIAADQKRQARETLRKLRAELATAKQAWKAAASEVRARCKSIRVACKVKIRELRARARKQLGLIANRQRHEAREACKLAKARAREEYGTKVEQAAARLRAEREFQAQMRRIERTSRERAQNHPHAAYLERRGESDDLVRSNIPSDLIPLFETVKRNIKPTRLQSRTDAFLQYVHDHPHEALEAAEHEAIREVKRLQKEYYTQHQAVHPPPRRMRREPLAAIPF